MIADPAAVGRLKPNVIIKQTGGVLAIESRRAWCAESAFAHK
jgi:hypothetical protein